MDEKVLLDVQINAQEALKAYDLLRKRAEVLRTSLKDLEKAGLKGSQLYAETAQNLKNRQFDDCRSTLGRLPIAPR